MSDDAVSGDLDVLIARFGDGDAEFVVDGESGGVAADLKRFARVRDALRAQAADAGYRGNFAQQAKLLAAAKDADERAKACERVLAED
jgi:hypothetical protein